MMIFEVLQVLRINLMYTKTFHNGTFGQVFHRLLEVTKNQRSSYELWYPPDSLHHFQQTCFPAITLHEKQRGTLTLLYCC